MIIQVTCPSGAATPEWIILELQGKLQPSPALSGAPIDGQLLGCITPAAGGKVALQVGSYKTTGALVTLAKPLVVMKASAHEDLAGAAAPPHAEYRIAAVVRRKFVFKDRPQPIVGAGAHVSAQMKH